jgi:hypothetical protein
MLRLLLEKEDVFQGTIQENGWWTKLAGKEYHPEEETGLICKGGDGLPAALT